MVKLQVSEGDGSRSPGERLAFPGERKRKKVVLRPRGGWWVHGHLGPLGQVTPLPAWLRKLRGRWPQNPLWTLAPLPLPPGRRWAKPCPQCLAAPPSAGSGSSG